MHKYFCSPISFHTTSSSGKKTAVNYNYSIEQGSSKRSVCRTTAWLTILRWKMYRSRYLKSVRMCGEGHCHTHEHAFFKSNIFLVCGHSNPVWERWKNQPLHLMWKWIYWYLTNFPNPHIKEFYSRLIDGGQCANKSLLYCPYKIRQHTDDLKQSVTA